MVKGEAHRFLTWSEHLKAYFRREGITNSVTQARLAERTFRGKVARWWNAHNDRHPGRLLSFARLLELLRTEMVPAADPSAACLQWSNLQYEGKPDAFLKELDRLTDTYPLDRAALIQLATRPFPPEFAGQVQTADALHGRRGMTYPQLRTMISNYMKTLTKRTRPSDTADPPETPSSDQGHDRPDRRYRHRPKLHAQPAPLQSSNPARPTPAAPPAAAPHGTRPPRMPQATAPPYAQPPYQQPMPAPQAPNTYGPIRRGKGTNPCFVCGAADHAWIFCTKKMAGRGCAVCGSLAHRTSTCAQRFHPELQAQWYPAASHAPAPIVGVTRHARRHPFPKNLSNHGCAGPCDDHCPVSLNIGPGCTTHRRTPCHHTHDLGCLTTRVPSRTPISHLCFTFALPQESAPQIRAATVSTHPRWMPRNCPL